MVLRKAKVNNNARHLIGPQITMLVAGLLALSACLGTRLYFWEYPVGFTGLGISMVLFLASALWAFGLLLFKWRQPSLRRGDLLGLAGLNLVVLGWVGYHIWLALQTPRLLDITTDVQHPPAYMAVAELRRRQDHPVYYPGPAAAEMQQQLYPDIQTVITLKVRDRVYREIRQLIVDRGWEIVYEDRPGGHLEAVDTSFWFGFRDDIVVRIDQRGPGSILDIRSSSRVGQNDLGANARRVQQLIADFRAREIEIDADLRERIRQRSDTAL